MADTLGRLGKFVKVYNHNFGEHEIDCKIIGKLKNVDAYIVKVKTKQKMDVDYFYLTYGRPIRNIELEYGEFTGNNVEFIVPAKHIRGLYDDTINIKTS